MEKHGINVRALKESIPHGGITEIAKRAKCDHTTVSKALNTGVIRPNLLFVIKEYLQEINQLHKEINTLIEA